MRYTTSWKMAPNWSSVLHKNKINGRLGKLVFYNAIWWGIWFHLPSLVPKINEINPDLDEKTLKERKNRISSKWSLEIGVYWKMSLSCRVIGIFQPKLKVSQMKSKGRKKKTLVIGQFSFSWVFSWVPRQFLTHKEATWERPFSLLSIVLCICHPIHGTKLVLKSSKLRILYCLRPMITPPQSIYKLPTATPTCLMIFFPSTSDPFDGRLRSWRSHGSDHTFSLLLSEVHGHLISSFTYSPFLSSDMHYCTAILNF